MKAIYVESDTPTARNNAIAASALSMMSSSDHHLPLRDTSNLTNGTIGVEISPAPVIVNHTPASGISLEEDSQVTRLNTFDESAQFPISFAQLEEVDCNEVSSNQENTPDYGTVPCSYDPHHAVAVPEIHAGPPEWEALSPDVMIKCCKTVPSDSLWVNGIRDFYKSYPSWAKMTHDQKNKMVAWFRSLPEDVQGNFFKKINFITVLLFFCINLPFFALHAESVVESAMTMSEELEQNAMASAVQTKKDDIARLLHLYKELIAQRHWTDLYSILSRPELDERKSEGEYGVAANPLAS
jgi:hypothetical protein